MTFWLRSAALAAMLTTLLLQACDNGASVGEEPSPSASTDPDPTTGNGNGATTVESAAYRALVASQAREQRLAGTRFDKPWAFDAGSEFPGARGGLVLEDSDTPGEAAASLLADLNCGASTVQLSPVNGCGLYVAMTQKLGSLQPASAQDAMVTFEVQASHPLLDSTLRVQDRTGQVLQLPYSTRSLESPTATGWASVRVPIGAATTYWGGAQDGRLHDGVSAVSVTAGAPTLTGPGASLRARNLRLLASGASQLALSRASTLAQEGVRPTLDGRFAVTAAYDRLSDQALSQAASVGISVVRLDLFWRDIEVGGRFNFSVYDAILRRLERQGLSALLILSYGHPDHGGGGSPVAPADRAAFAEFARQAALFAVGRNVTAFEVWNEPDNTRFWQQGDPDSYALLLRDARAAIKSVDASRKVINGGTSWVNLPYTLRLARTGQLAGLDGFAVHPYRRLSPETFAADLAPIQAVLSAQGVNPPVVWGTEWGYPSVGQFDTARFGNGHDPRALQRQGVLVLRTALTQLALNLPMMTLYELCDAGADANNSEHNYGLLTQAGEPKPAFVGLQSLYRATHGRRYVGLVKEVPPNVHAMRWDGPQDTVFAVWTDSAAVPLKLNLPPAATATSWTGQALAPTTTAGAPAAELQLSEADGPVFVRFPGKAE